MATSNSRQIRYEIEALLAEGSTDEELREQTRDIAEDVREFAQEIAPVRTGKFKRSIKIKQLADRKFLPAYQVYSDDPKAPYLEYGTNDTPEFAVFAKAAAHFNSKSIRGAFTTTRAIKTRKRRKRR